MRKAVKTSTLNNTNACLMLTSVLSYMLSESLVLKKRHVITKNNKGYTAIFRTMSDLWIRLFLSGFLDIFGVT